jgi:hypothetical protein
MSNTRRQFLGSLARGVLLPIGGGALTLADPAKAGSLRVTRGDLPVSPDALLLRSLKRDLSVIQRRMNRDDDTYSYRDADRDWHAIIQEQVTPLEARMLARPVATWADCVELAEICWWGVAHRRSLNGDVARGTLSRTDACDVLVDAVLSLGGGQRSYPQGDARLSI